MRWTREGDAYVTTYKGRPVMAYRTPGRRRGWTVEVDGVADLGLAACSTRLPACWTASVQRVVERVVRGRIDGPPPMHGSGGFSRPSGH